VSLQEVAILKGNLASGNLPAYRHPTQTFSVLLMPAVSSAALVALCLRLGDILIAKQPFGLIRNSS